jgi:hypothetical protein
MSLYVLCDYFVTLIGMSLNKNCFLFIQVMRGNVEKMDTKTSPVSSKCQRGPSFVVGYMFVLVLVNPLSATPLFSPSSLARAALFGLVVYKPWGRRVANPKICRKAPFSGNAPWFPLFSTDLSAMASPTWSWILQTWRVD